MLTQASAGHDENNQPDINFAFNGNGSRRFAEATTANIGKPFAIVLDKQVISAPRINSAITGGTGQITGNFTEESAHNLALLLKSGGLPAPLNVIAQHTVGAEFGADAVKAGQLSILIGAALIFAFIILSYGLFGGFAAIALVINGLMIVGAMSLTQATLTLPGIAGLVLTLAVAVDANVLIYERMRDEVRSGRQAMSAADAGFKRALTTIIDANVTTLVASVIMFQFGSGPGEGLRLDPVHRRDHLGVHRRPDHPGPDRLVVPHPAAEDAADRRRSAARLAADQAAADPDALQVRAAGAAVRHPVPDRGASGRPSAPGSRVSTSASSSRAARCWS